MENQYLTKSGYNFKKSEEKRKQSLHSTSHVMHSFAQIKRKKDIASTKAQNKLISIIFKL